MWKGSKHARDMKDRALVCFCMECPTCLSECDYNRINYGGKRFVGMLGKNAKVYIVKNHHTCSWCHFGLDIRYSSFLLDGKRSMFNCPICLSPNGLKDYADCESVKGETIDQYHVVSD